MSLYPGELAGVLLTLLVVITASSFAAPLVAAQQDSLSPHDASAAGSSATAVELSDSQTSRLSMRIESINISVTDSSNGQDSASVGVTVSTSTPDAMPGAVSDTVTSQQWSTIVGADNKPQATELSAALRSWADTRSYNGVDYEATDLSAILRYWSNTQ